MEEKRLYLRLSSLGDVILASSALQVQQADWVVAKEFSGLLVGHPALGKLWQFDRKVGFRGWLQLCRQLWDEKYTEVYDLHGSLRTQLMKLFFRCWWLTEGGSFPSWKTVSKQRWRLFSYFTFKRHLPRTLRPLPWTQRFSAIVGGTGDQKPDLRHLVGVQTIQSLFPADLIARLNTHGYLCVMPSSKWNGKKWPVSHYVSLFQNSRRPIPVVLGTAKDPESGKLCEELTRAGIIHFNGTGRWTLRETAAVLAHSKGYLGNDTGLAHLAQAVGVPATVIFGPTVSDMGFGPWGEKSQAIGLDLGCRPCGKDGRFCYRFHQRYECLRGLSPEVVGDRLP